MTNHSSTPRHEVGESQEADFEKGTWTFHFNGYYTVSAGLFAILPLEHHEGMTKKLDHASRLLRHLREKAEPHEQEKIDSFFDPEPL